MFEASANTTVTKLRSEYDPWAYNLLNVNTNNQVSRLFLFLTLRCLRLDPHLTSRLVTFVPSLIQNVPFRLSIR